MFKFKKELDNERKERKFFFFLDNLLNFLKTIFSFAFALELIKTLIICLAIVLPIRYFLIQPFYVIGASMEPNFYDHEYLIIDELSYRFREPARGEIVVFKYPKEPRQYFIKRIIALPGERIEISEGAVKIYNQEYPEGEMLDERGYLPGKIENLRQVDMTLKDDEYFVLGDNRNSSFDSRSFGPVEKKFIVGKALLRGWPFNRINYFSSPSYNF